MSLETMLGALSTSEKLDAMTILWRDLSENAAAFESPSWHRDILVHRLANPSAKPKLSLDAAIEDVRERLNARRSQG